MTKSASEAKAQTWDTVTYTLSYANLSSATVNNAVITDSLPNAQAVSFLSASIGGSYNSTTNTITWNIGSLGPGMTGTVSYQVKITLYAAKYSPLVNNAQLSYLGGSLTTSHSLPVAGGYTVTIAVYNQAGEVVKTLNSYFMSYPVNGFDMSNSVIATLQSGVSFSSNGIPLGVWDGTDNSGNEVTDGTYMLKITSTDPYGIAITTTHTVTVQVLKSTLNIVVYNEAGEVVKQFNAQELASLLSGNLLPADYNVGVAKTGPSLITPSYTNPNGNGNYMTITLGSGRSFKWNGTGDNGQILPSGNYYLVITSNVAGGKGGQEEVVKGFTVQAADRNGITAFYAQPNVVDTNQSGAVTFMVSTGITQIDYTKVKLYTVAGEYITTLTSQANPVQVPWDFSQNPVASGTYIAVAELYSNGTMVGRQITRVVVLR